MKYHIWINSGSSITMSYAIADKEITCTVLKEDAENFPIFEKDDIVIIYKKEPIRSCNIVLHSLGKTSFKKIIEVAHGAKFDLLPQNVREKIQSPPDKQSAFEISKEDYTFILNEMLSSISPLEKYAIKNNCPNTLQQIIYGAPGTGKSHKIKKEIADCPHFRTTFHPDSDYSSFVGAYKPTMKEVYVRDSNGKVIVDDGKNVTEDKIIYEFVAQSFLDAYISAWKNYPKQQYLIIEEINRGNCAQIFGDLFQLLDRNESGFSDYPIQADNDIHIYIQSKLRNCTFANDDMDKINVIYAKEYDCIIQKVLNGEVLLLPSNLSIWATMNTSDQSLFPIDSAFKRRWDWKYIPISNAEKGWQISVNGGHYDWWLFLDKINTKIFEATDSEDKKLGYFFVKADDDLNISADKFVGKVIFYLWNDVFKDYGFDDNIFKDTEDETDNTLSFQKFFDSEGKANEGKVEIFLKNLGVKKGEKDNTKYFINGNGEYPKCQLATEMIKIYVDQHKEKTASEIIEDWKPLSRIAHFVENETDHEKETDVVKERANPIICNDNSTVWVSRNGWIPDTIKELIKKVNEQDWNIHVEEKQIE